MTTRGERCRAHAQVYASFIAGLIASSVQAAPAAEQPAVAALVRGAEPPSACAPSSFSKGPIVVGLSEKADVATARRVCPRTEFGLAPRVDAIIDTPGFYGAIAANLVLIGSWSNDPRREVFATLELARYHYVVNAVINASSFGVGRLTAGVSQITVEGRSWASATTMRVMLPTTTMMKVREVGAELGQGLTIRASDTVDLHAFVGTDVSGAVFSPTGVRPWFGATFNVGVHYSASSWLALAADVNAHAGPLTWLAPAAALRLRFGPSWSGELAASRPLLGTDRHDLVAVIRVVYRP